MTPFLPTRLVGNQWLPCLFDTVYFGRINRVVHQDANVSLGSAWLALDAITVFAGSEWQ